jgi:hypothetical protein
MSVEITGIRELNRKLKQLSEKVQKKLVRAAMVASLRVTAKAIKSEVPSTWKEGRKAIGYSFKRGKTPGVTFAKAGVGAGMKKAKRAKAKQKPRIGHSGVGIGVGNLHWFILGTAERFTGSKRVGARRKGVVNRRVSTGNAVRRTGKLQPNAIVKRGDMKSKGAAKAALITNLKAGIEREAKK